MKTFDRSATVPMTTIRRLLFPLMSAGAVMALPACSSQADVASGSANVTSEQEGIDVQVLQVWTAGRVIPSIHTPALSPSAADIVFDSTDPSICSPAGTVPNTNIHTVDCTDAIKSRAVFDLNQQPGPLLAPVHFNITTFASGEPPMIDRVYCDRVEVRVLLRDAAANAPTFLGVGFYTSEGDGFTPKNELQLVGHAQLKNGDGAGVYRFAGISTCVSSDGSTSSNAFQTFGFKPYAAYGNNPQDPNATVYRVWEQIQGDFLLGHSWPGADPVVNSTGFDRQNDLLNQ